MLRGLFWMSMGAALGVLGYRYYQQNGGRLPVIGQLLGGRGDEVVTEAQRTVRTAGREAQEKVSETTGSVARDAMVSVAEEITEAERAKQRKKVLTEGERS